MPHRNTERIVATLSTITMMLVGVLVMNVKANDPLCRSSGISDKTKIYTEENKRTFKPEYSARPAVIEDEQFKKTPDPKAYVAFSLRDAQHVLKGLGDAKGWRCKRSDIFCLGGINSIAGAVHDRQRDDLIIVGKYVPGRQPLTLDDFVIALRALFVHADFPSVSIDPTLSTSTTGKQDVHFKAGIENTQFGADLLDADYRMKLIGYDLLPAA